MLDEDRILQYLHDSFSQYGSKSKCSREKKISKQIRERRKFGVIANLSYSKYELVRKSIHEAGFTITDKEDLTDAFLIWTDNFLPFEKIMNLKSYQRVNHFPGMIEICRKDFLAKNFMRMNRSEPEEYSFLPKTWVLPQEHGFFLNYVRSAASRGSKPVFIMKPANGAMGHGIRLYRSGENVPSNPANGTPCVIQEYIHNPLLIDGYKCDLRVYVLVTSCDPLRVFIYNEGLVRLSTEKYIKPTEPHGESMYMHLTNYAVNKRHADYVASTNEMDGSKRSFGFLDQYLRNTRQVDPNIVWRGIRDLIVKTMALAVPHLLHSYRMCRRGRSRLMRTYYSLECLTQPQNAAKSQIKVPMCNYNGERENRESTEHLSTTSINKQTRQRLEPNMPFFQSSFFEILGFDILIDSELKPWLIEVNRSPSFNGDQELDRRVKQGLLKDALHLLNIRHVDKKNAEKEQKLFSVRRLYRSATPALNRFQTKDCSVDHAGKPEGRKFHLNTFRSLTAKWSYSNVALETEIDKLYHQLICLRRRLALEFFEYHNSGNWCLIFPTDDRPSQKRFSSLLLINFAQFHNGKGGHLQKELEDTYLRTITEEDIMERLNRLLQKHDEVSLRYKEIFYQDSDGYQVDDYDVTSSSGSSTQTETPGDDASDSGPVIGPGLMTNKNVSDCSFSPANSPHGFQRPEPTRISPLKHLLKRNIKMYRGEHHKPVLPLPNLKSVRSGCTSVPRRL